MKNVLVTLADANYIDQAKQLFSGVYWNAGWDGDYLLLAHQIPEEKLAWFKDKGIRIYECQPLGQGNVGSMDYHSPVVLSKFYLFDPFFKQWEKIVFLDADIIVRGSLEELKGKSGFWARPDIHDFALDQQIDYYRRTADPSGFGELIRRLGQSYDLSSPSFNSGVMVIDTSLIEPDSFAKIRGIWEEYRDMSKAGEQLILNLFMYGKWNHLPRRFNCYIPDTRQSGFFLRTDVISPILHFFGPIKVWHKRNPFRSLWKSNLARAEGIDLGYVLAVRVPSSEETSRSEGLIAARDRFLSEKFFPDPDTAKELDGYYAENMMKEFRRFLAKVLLTRYSRAYARYIPYFFISYIPLALRLQVKKALFISSR